MPKENKPSSRWGRRHCLDVNDERSSPCIRDLVKTPLSSKRYSPFQRDSNRRDSRGSRDFKELRESPEIKARRDSPGTKDRRESRESREAKEPRDSRASKEVRPIENSVDLAGSSVEKENMTVTLHKSNNSIIGNGIKYIMFPLHLLHLCIFGTSTAAISAEKPADAQEEVQEPAKHVEKTEDTDKKDDKDQRKPREDRSKTPEAKSLSREKSARSEESRERTERRSKSPLEEIKPKPRQEIISEDDDSSDEMVTAPEDSDSASDHWCSANDTMMMNMSVDCDYTLEKSMSFALEEPMDVCMEEDLDSALPSSKAGREERRSRRDERRSTTPRGRPDGCADNTRESGSRFRSVDEEIATIFQKQCTSSEDESPVPLRPVTARSYRESRAPGSRAENRDTSAGSRAKKATRDDNNNNERKKKSTGDFAMNKRRKTSSREDDASQRRSERRNEEEIIEEKYTPSKRRSRSSRTPSKVKETTKRREVKYKEIGIQTDSAFSDEEDVEMTPLDAKATEKSPKSCRRLQTASPQVEDMDQDLHYIADNEDSNDGYVKFARKRISSGSASSSSADLGFDERSSIMTEADYRSSRWKLEGEDRQVFGNQMTITRAPPGFPKQPQHPPLISCACRNASYVSTQSRIFEHRQDHLQGSSVPPAPTPMRHMYYNYPEFMDLPGNIGSSKILWNVIRNNYR